MPETNNMFSLSGSVIVFTGGTGVLGSVLCRSLAHAGASVVVLGRNGEVAQQVASGIEKAGGQSLAIVANVLERAELEEARSRVIKQFGKIDILVNAAGGNKAGAVVPPEKTFFDLSVDDFRSVVDLNLLGTLLPTQVFGEAMAAQKKGVVVNISSMAALRPLTRVGGYAAAKAAVSNFTQWLAVEMAMKFGEGIRVNAIAPGFFLTEQNRTLLTNSDGSLTERGKSIVAHTPFGRFGDPRELSGTLIWLCSDASRFVSGIVVPVDGGFSAYAGI